MTALHLLIYSAEAVFAALGYLVGGLLGRWLWERRRPT